MKHTNSKKFKETVFRYLIDSAYDVDGLTDTQIVQHIYNRWQVEHCHAYNRHRYSSVQTNIEAWLQGLPLNIDYNYADIQTVTERWHDCKLTDKDCEKHTQNWFNFLAFKLIQLFNAYDIKIDY